MLRSLLYTSRKTIPLEREVAEISQILALSRAWNAAAGITGGLINTPNAFTQLLEGPTDAIDDLMSRIAIDRRHENVQILRFAEITQPRLPGWSMAYSGPWTYVAKRVEPLVGGNMESDPEMIDDLTELIVRFARS